MTPQRTNAVPWNWVTAAALSAAYVVFSVAWRAFEVLPNASAWYPAAALVAGACIVWGGRALLPLVAGGVVSAIIVGYRQPLWATAVESFVLKACYWGAAVTLHRLSFDPSFGRPREVARFIMVTAVAALLAACSGAVFEMATGQVAFSEARRAVAVFWIGDVVSVLALTPTLLAAARVASRGLRAQRWRPDRTTVIQILSVPLTVAFGYFATPRLSVLAFAVGILPLGWIAVTRGVAAATLAGAALDIGAIALSAARDPGNLELQTLIALLAIAALLLGSVAEERERARSLLAGSETLYRSLVELLPDPLLVHREGRILYGNEAAARTLGVPSAGALKGMSLSRLAAPESRERIERRIAQLASGEAVGRVEHRMLKTDGSGAVDVESVSIPIEYDGSTAALTVARDITMRKRLEEQVRHMQRLESMGRLAAGVAHDFNNMLSVMIGCTDLLLDKLGPQSADRALVKDIAEAAQRGATLTRQLLTFSRKQEARKSVVELAAVVRGTESLLRRLIDKSIELRFELWPSAPVEADPAQLEQMLVNLAVNARDAMPRGGALVIETRGVELGANETRWAGVPVGAYSALFVRDTGDGMSPEIKAHIFEPFFTTKPEGRGTGLGLATVYGIVQQSGGHIAVESQPGAGTVFGVFLPGVKRKDQGPPSGDPDVTSGSGGGRTAAHWSAVGVSFASAS